MIFRKIKNLRLFFIVTTLVLATLFSFPVFFFCGACFECEVKGRHVTWGEGSETMAADGGGGAVQGGVARPSRLRVCRKIAKRGDPKQRQLGPPEECLESEPVVARDEAAEEGGEGAAVTGDDLPLPGTISVIGRRREMEDAVRVVVGFYTLGDGRGYDFYGVYDGHGGSQVAEFCSGRLHQLIAEELEDNGGDGRDGEVQWEKVMAECFAKADDEVRLGGVELALMGSTAVVAVVGAEVVVVANCGDSRAVISRDGVAVALSEDHKPNRPDELTRIRAAGGKVIDWDGHRVLGVLATSRSIGDQYLKPFVISEPDVRVSPRTDSDEFLILGSDGLWDVIPNEYACRVVRRCLKGTMKRKSHEGPVANRLAEAAAVLTELATARGSQDNISVIVVELNSKKFSAKKSP